MIDRDTEKVLLHTRDTILNKKMDEKDFEDGTITQWIIGFAIKKVLKLRKNEVDWDRLFEEDDNSEE